MFTGIVERSGEIVGVERTEDGRRLAIAAPGIEDVHHGQSIAISGVCLTVERHGKEVEIVEARPELGDAPGADDPEAGSVFEVFLASETVDKTYLGELGVGDRVNLERALAADGRFDGHLVQGHVDTVTTVTGIERVGEDWTFSFAVPPEFDQYVVHKGSVALDGISLTVAERREDEMDVAIIPTTYELTTLSDKEVGDPVHLEVDVVAKYVESIAQGYLE
ncbi:Riboflavin synthase alpha chain [Halalkaliarchaeum sp. AArc-CO]|uniref:riboflavin synthase n=1 Tax=Halalkaliarchaeum sp. AArc-CO TaxID=2866381 RepID=UPI00217EF5F0|nr:riboflavin synthase [Halalkaliarchaeum sp. AArc-CO]UWG51954.1 Riboflavin synthase alpha chain [Halalkaliarchaeum sp. AArc-CO]